MHNHNLPSRILFYALPFLFSCAAKKNNEVLLEELNSAIISSSQLAHVDAMNTMEVFKLKLSDPTTKAKAELWFPKVQRVHEATTELTNFIESLKQTVQTQINTEGNKTGNSSAVNELLIDNGKYKELYKRLRQYREQILLTDSMRLSQLKNYIFITSKEQDTIDNEHFFKQCLTAAPPIGTLAYLNRLQNNVVIAGARCLRYYSEQIMMHRRWFNSYEAILGQNAKILKAGDVLEITGGVGAFSIQRLLQFSVNGKNIQPNERGMAVYKFRTSKKPGSYSLPVHIRLLDEDSLEHTAVFQVEYTLVDAVKKH